MMLKNTTTISTELVRDIIRFTCPPGVSGFDISVKNTRRWFRGMAYTDGCSYHGNMRPLVTVSVGAPKMFPKVFENKRMRPGYLPSPPMGTRVEALVFVTAHELRHLWQKRVKRGRRVWGARGQYSERDADAYAIHMLREWRRK